MKNFEVGQKVRVVGDTFKQDPHGVPVGEEVVIEKINPKVPFDEIPPMIKFLLAISGVEGKFDIPERVHVQFGDIRTNIPFTDVEPITYETIKVQMLEDDYADGYSRGDVFEAFYSTTEDEYMFHDKDGDVRFLIDHEHKEIK